MVADCWMNSSRSTATGFRTPVADGRWRSGNARRSRQRATTIFALCVRFREAPVGASPVRDLPGCDEVRAGFSVVTSRPPEARLPRVPYGEVLVEGWRRSRAGVSLGRAANPCGHIGKPGLFSFTSRLGCPLPPLAGDGRRQPMASGGARHGFTCLSAPPCCCPAPFMATVPPTTPGAGPASGWSARMARVNHPIAWRNPRK